MPRTVVPAENPGSNMHPKVAAFASLFPPFIRHAKTDPFVMQNLCAIHRFSGLPLSNLPT
jgi:hypothetical protein